MIGFALGVLVGLVIATLLAVLYAVFSAPIASFTLPVKTALTNAGPRPKGHIFLPEDEAETARKELLRENAKRNIDTPISDLL